MTQCAPCIRPTCEILTFLDISDRGLRLRNPLWNWECLALIIPDNMLPTLAANSFIGQICIQGRLVQLLVALISVFRITCSIFPS